MKLSPPRPSTNAFAVFSMLLLGVFAAALVVVFDYWFGGDKSLSTVVLRRLQESKVPLYWVMAIGGLTLMAFGFFFYNLSFLAIAAPAFVVKQTLQFKIVSIFERVSSTVMSEFPQLERSDSLNARFRDTFMYMLLTSRDSPSASAARFNFTQLMFGRSIGAILVVFSAYVAWTLNLPAASIAVTVALTWLPVVTLYVVGLAFFDNVMAAGIVIVRSTRDAEPSNSGSAPSRAITTPATRRRSRPKANESPGNDA